MNHNYEGGEHSYIFATISNLAVPAVIERYTLPEKDRKNILSFPSPFKDAYPETVFLRTYSRDVDVETEEGTVTRKETWNDIILRVVEGTISSYLDHMKKNFLPINMGWLNEFARKMAISAFHRRWLPAGRGLYSMNTEHFRQSGSATLNNCYACKTTNLVLACSWMMDALMCGGGVGFDCSWDGICQHPDKSSTMLFVIPDTRQGWICALELLLRAYVLVDGDAEGSILTKPIHVKKSITNKFPIFDYSLVRPYGAKINGFGGTASGPEPLRVMLNRVEIFMDTYIEYKGYIKNGGTPDGSMGHREIFRNMMERLHEKNAYITTYEYDFVGESAKLEKAFDEHPEKKVYDKTRLIADVGNSIGSCVIAGNVRRSSQILLGDPGDETFLYLKDFNVNPERDPLMWCSNNTVRLWNNDDFEVMIPKIADLIRSRGEPGVANMINIKKYGRFADTQYGEDTADLLNPCGEIPLDSFGPCNLATVVPYNCRKDPTDPRSPIDKEQVKEAAEFATFYTSTVTTIRHHWPITNRIVSEKRRIGVSFGGVPDIYENYGISYLTTLCRSMYDTIRRFNTEFSKRAGIPPAIRVTTVKPEGTLSIVTEVTAGVHFPTAEYCKRRIGVSQNSPLLKPLIAAGYSVEKSLKNPDMMFVIFPLARKGIRPSREVSIFEQYGIVQCMQRHYADNAVSFTGMFSKERESDVVDRVMAMFIPMLKCSSMFGQSDDLDDTNGYVQIPAEEVTKETYEEMIAAVKPVDWGDLVALSKEKAVMPRGCSNDTCDL